MNVKGDLSTFKRGYRHGLMTAVDLVKRYSEYFADQPEVERVLKIVINEIPYIGLKHNAADGPDKEPK